MKRLSFPLTKLVSWPSRKRPCSLKQLDKFRKLGSDAATRLKNDIRRATLLAYLKQLEGLNIAKDTAAKAMAALEHSGGHGGGHFRGSVKRCKCR